MVIFGLISATASTLDHSIPECVLANGQLPDVLETGNLFTFHTLEILRSSPLVLPYIFI
jgi:hypothetical protein